MSKKMIFLTTVALFLIFGQVAQAQTDTLRIPATAPQELRALLQDTVLRRPRALPEEEWQANASRLQAVVDVVAKAAADAERLNRELETARHEAAADSTRIVQLEQQLAAAQAQAAAAHAEMAGLIVNFFENSTTIVGDTTTAEAWHEPRSANVAIGLANFQRTNVFNKQNSFCVDFSGNVMVGDPNGRGNVLLFTDIAGGLFLKAIGKQNPLMPIQRRLEGQYLQGSSSLLLNFAILQRSKESGTLFSVFGGLGAGVAGYQPQNWVFGYQLQLTSGAMIRQQGAEVIFMVILPLAGNVVGQSNPFGAWEAKLMATYKSWGGFISIGDATFSPHLDYAIRRPNGTTVGGNNLFTLYPKFGVVKKINFRRG